MQRAGQVDGEILGDIHQHRYRAQADRRETVFQPFRAFAVFDAGNQASGELRAFMRLCRGQTHVHFARADEAAGDRGVIERLKFAHAGGGQIAGDPAHA